MASPNAASEAYLNAMDREAAMITASHASAAFATYKEYGNWIWGHYINSTDEVKCGFRKDKGFLIMFKLMPEDVEDWEGVGDCPDKEGGKDGEEMDDDMEKADEDMFTGIPTLFKLFKI